VIFEDSELLAVNKPGGLNTHAPGPYAGEGIYDWLRQREPRWADLAIIHRLDKETSGVILFSKTPRANRSLTEQFTQREVGKKYLLLTDRPVPLAEWTARSCMVRTGEKYSSRPVHAGGALAETKFRRLTQAEVALSERGHSRQLPNSSDPQADPAGSKVHTPLLAEPLTGRTHQIRVHAAEKGFPVLGDTLYGGTPAPRIYLHAAELRFRHPVSGEEMILRAPADFATGAGWLLRSALIEPESTDTFRLIHGASDRWPGWYVDRLGNFLLSSSDQRLTAAQEEELKRLMKLCHTAGSDHKRLTRQTRGATPADTGPQHLFGEAAPDRFTVRENGLKFQLSFDEGYSVGLFLDQRDNRRRLLHGHIAAGFPAFPAGRAGTRENPPKVLNTFAYTCGFSVCAAKAGAVTTSLDLSKKYLAWGKDNFQLNGLTPDDHEFIQGDVFDWLRRMTKRRRLFDVVLLDPPTFSQSKASGVFQVKKDFGQLVSAALPLLGPGGVLFASTNAADWPPEKFMASGEAAVRSSKRNILQRHYAPQPPDFPVSRAEPAYLKTVWLRID
jgi:23S rRNA (cytosine1962-C5)-methyltransferase